MNMKTDLPELEFTPAVFAVNHTYQIMAVVKTNLVFWVTVGGKNYYDHFNGILRSAVEVHRVTVPMAELDAAQSYTVHYRTMPDRKPYFNKPGEEVSAEFPFRPVPAEGPIHLYQLADTHGVCDIPVQTARYFGENLDILLLNGDIPDSNDIADGYKLTFRLCEALTGGQLPCVFSRGNHDLRGKYAENYEENSPTDRGRSYYTFRLGRVWGVVLDCGEDKDDSRTEYGWTVSCHPFREEQTEFLQDVIRRADEEYAAPGVEYRLLIAHNPFSYIQEAPFDIEQDIYSEWLRLLGESVKPQLMLAGHIHELNFVRSGDPWDTLGQVCPVAVGSKPVGSPYVQLHDFYGCALTMEGTRMTVQFTDKAHNVLQNEEVEIDPRP